MSKRWMIVTAGGTREPIDSVRYVGNSSSGRTGKRIAEVALERGFAVSLLVAQDAVRPEPNPGLEVLEFDSTKSLIGRFQELRLRSPNPHLCIHAAAVSDYAPELVHVGKISSAEETWSLRMKRNPKIVTSIKSWFPGVRLIQFKLLVGSDPTELWLAARAGLKSSGGDLCVANDLADVSMNSHRAWLVEPEGEPLLVESRDALAVALLDRY